MQCTRQWGVSGPPEVRRASRGDEPGEHDQRPEHIQPVRERVEPRECDIGCADLQRKNVVRETVGHRYRVEQQRSEEHTSELQSLMRISYAVFCLKKKKNIRKYKKNTN